MPAPTALGAVHDSTGFSLVGVVAVRPVGAAVAATAAPGHASTAATTSAARLEGSRKLTAVSIGLHAVHLDKFTHLVDWRGEPASDARASCRTAVTAAPRSPD